MKKPSVRDLCDPAVTPKREPLTDQEFEQAWLAIEPHADGCRCPVCDPESYCPVPEPEETDLIADVDHDLF